MYCSKCGAKLNEDDSFCRDCGQATPFHANAHEHISLQISAFIKYIEMHVRLLFAIIVNINVAIMFILRWFKINGLVGELTEIHIDTVNGITIAEALSAINKAIQLSKISDADVGGVIILQALFIALLIIPVVNIFCVFMLFLIKQRARHVLLISGVYTMSVSVLFIILFFIYNVYLSNDKSDLASTLLGVSLMPPVYVTAILGLAQIVLFGYERRVVAVRSEKAHVKKKDGGK
ncbi:hypothetical protein FACS1894132_09070 [Clostridia bacterium]|nr:hypothetical protein FACS1894132_09070 [Clostridia bacterium]